LRLDASCGIVIIMRHDYRKNISGMIKLWWLVVCPKDEKLLLHWWPGSGCYTGWWSIYFLDYRLLAPYSTWNLSSNEGEKWNPSSAASKLKIDYFIQNGAYSYHTMLSMLKECQPSSINIQNRIHGTDLVKEQGMCAHTGLCKPTAWFSHTTHAPTLGKSHVPITAHNYTLAWMLSLMTQTWWLPHTLLSCKPHQSRRHNAIWHSGMISWKQVAEHWTPPNVYGSTSTGSRMPMALLKSWHLQYIHHSSRSLPHPTSQSPFNSYNHMKPTAIWGFNSPLMATAKQSSHSSNNATPSSLPYSNNAHFPIVTSTLFTSNVIYLWSVILYQ